MRVRDDKSWAEHTKLQMNIIVVYMSRAMMRLPDDLVHTDNLWIYISHSNPHSSALLTRRRISRPFSPIYPPPLLPHTHL